MTKREQRAASSPAFILGLSEKGGRNATETTFHTVGTVGNPEAEGETQLHGLPCSELPPKRKQSQSICRSCVRTRGTPLLRLNDTRLHIRTTGHRVPNGHLSASHRRRSKSSGKKPAGPQGSDHVRSRSCPAGTWPPASIPSASQATSSAPGPTGDRASALPAREDGTHRH